MLFEFSSGSSIMTLVIPIPLYFSNTSLNDSDLSNYCSVLDSGSGFNLGEK